MSTTGRSGARRRGLVARSYALRPPSGSDVRPPAGHARPGHGGPAGREGVDARRVRHRRTRPSLRGARGHHVLLLDLRRPHRVDLRRVAEALPYPVPHVLADPYESASPHHRWGRSCLHRASCAQAPHSSPTPSSSGTRSAGHERRHGRKRLGETDLRHGLDLRSSWFQLGVMRLDAPAPATYGAPSSAGSSGDSRSECAAARAGVGRSVARVRPLADGALGCVPARSAASCGSPACRSPAGALTTCAGRAPA